MRNTIVEVYRLLLMLEIFIWHIFVHGLGFKYLGTDSFSYDGGLLFPIAICAMCASATYSFMFISGYYGIHYSHKKLLYLVFSVYSVVIVSTVIKLLIGRFSVNDVFLFLPLSRGHWWFLTWYVVILVLSPIINKGLEISQKQFLFILIVLLVLLCLSIVKLSSSFGSSFFGLLCMYLLGRYFRIYRITLSFLHSLLGILVSFVVFLSLILFVVNYAPLSRYSFVLLGGYNNPMVIVMAICSFFLVLCFKPRTVPQINEFLRPVLFIYLVSESFNPYLYQWIAQSKAPILLLIGVSIVSLFLGLMLSTLFDWIWSKTEHLITR